MKHTELPWKRFSDNQIQSESKRESFCPVVWASGLSTKNAEANAEFIVKAVNNHEKLLEALREVENIYVPVTGPEKMVFELVKQAIKAAEE